MASFRVIMLLIISHPAVQAVLFRPAVMPHRIVSAHMSVRHHCEGASPAGSNAQDCGTLKNAEVEIVIHKVATTTETSNHIMLVYAVSGLSETAAIHRDGAVVKALSVGRSMTRAPPSSCFTSRT